MRTLFIRLTITGGNDNLKNDFNVNRIEKDQGSNGISSYWNASGDLGEGCASETYTTQYGNFTHGWLKLNEETVPQGCEFDDRTAIFTCKKASSGNLYVEETYHCQSTATTEAIQNLADDTVTLLSLS